MAKLTYLDVMAKARATSYWDLTPEEQAVIKKHDDREHRRRRNPRSGNSETIMRNRVQRAKGFGLTRDNTY